MMVTFVSMCEKNSLKKTRRVLDAFANRIGDNTWQTVITNEGLAAVKKLLRKTATKNTAVSCHWIRTRARSELVWVVGKRERFNSVGLVPTNFTLSKRLTHRQENDWQYLPLIQSLAAVAALFHDWGKATALFQEKLKPSCKQGFKGDPIRHEWISCLLLSAFINRNDNENIVSDESWLERLAQQNVDERELSEVLANVDVQIHKNPFIGLPPMAKLVAWLVVSHHRLPNLNKAKDKADPNKHDAEYYMPKVLTDIDELLLLISKEWGYQNKFDESEYQQRVKQCFNFPKGLLSQSKKWQLALKKWALKLWQQNNLASRCLSDGCYRVILHHARLCLMLGDHYYSSQTADNKWQDTTGLFANTDRETKKLKQKLDEHLIGVAKHAIQTAYYLPAFETQPPKASDINSLKKLSPKNYRWQDKAVENIKAWRKTVNQDTYGFFAVNMASTGCGKTFANAKVMRALSPDGDSLRFTLALGLRTLTLQTGDEYRERIGLDDSELAVLIGSSAVLELHNKNRQAAQQTLTESYGSESQEQLIDEDIDYDCDIPEEGLATVLTCARDRKFLYAPVLSCTIDHMMAATETTRGGRYILPSLRMMSSDLVIDEIDDFSGDDLVAIGRLIFFAAMMGRKVMISSATIPPDLAEGYFKAYRDGWKLYAKTRQVNPLIGCAWIDEFSTQVTSNTGVTTVDAIKHQYRTPHSHFIDSRIKRLQKQPAKRKADIVPCQVLIDDYKSSLPHDENIQSTKQQRYFSLMFNAALLKHQQHYTNDDSTGINVSFGVVRLANISTCVALTRYLLELTEACPQDTQIRTMAYHSQQVLLLRSEQERHLDEVLKRKESKGEQPQAFRHPVIRKHLACANKNPKIKNLIFVLIATPVEEVGRDHDFDWAVIEPSSYRSIIQLSGRVKRHRSGEVTQPNIAIMQYNWKGIRDAHLENNRVFNKPGFEEKITLGTHDVTQLLDISKLEQKVDASARIKKSAKSNSTLFRAIGEQKRRPASLAELEHAATWMELANYQQQGPRYLQGYLNESWFLTGLPQTFVRFRASTPNVKSYLSYMPDLDTFKFCEKDDNGWPVDRQKTLGITVNKLSERAQTNLWLARDFSELIEGLAQQQEKSLRSVSLRYGELSFPHQAGKQYSYNDQLGLVKN